MAPKKEVEEPAPGDPGPLAKAADLKAEKVTAAPGKGRTVRVTAIGRNDYKFKGVKFTKDGVHVDPKTLGWNEADWVAAHADPTLVIEEFEDGKAVGKDGMVTAPSHFAPGRNHGPQEED